MMSKFLCTAAALAIVLPVAAHAEDAATGSTYQDQQRQMERSRFEMERSAVRDRLNPETDSVAEPTDTTAGTSANPATLNTTAPASGESTMDGYTPSPSSAPSTPRSSYND